MTKSSKDTKKKKVWAWCPKCMDRQDHEVVPGKGIKCLTCGLIQILKDEKD